MAEDEIPNSQDEVSGTPKPQKPKPSSVRMEWKTKFRKMFTGSDSKSPIGGKMNSPKTKGDKNES